MSAVMLIIKQIRPSRSIPFYQRSEQDLLDDKAAMREQSIRVMHATDTFKKGLKKVDILFFPDVQYFERWQESQRMFEAQAARSAYNEANGIIERVIEKNFSKLFI